MKDDKVDNDDDESNLCKGCGYWYTSPGEDLCVVCSFDDYDEDDYWNDV